MEQSGGGTVVLKSERTGGEKEEELGDSHGKLDAGLAGSSSAVMCTTMKIEGLEASIKKLVLEEGELKDDNGSSKVKLISKLEEARFKSAEEERLARRAAWTAEARAEVLRRQQFRAEGREELLPELVLKLILSKLDSNDKGAMSRMSLLWRDLLKNERTAFLFDMIFPLLHQCEDLPRAEILSCRGVCKEWKQSLENYLQNNMVVVQFAEVLEMIGKYANPRAETKVMDHLTMVFKGEPEHLTKLLDQTMKNVNQVGSPRMMISPFISRKLRLGFQYPIMTHFPFFDAVVDQYWDEVTNLLSLWGEHVWEVEISCDENSTAEMAYDRFCGLLRLMPKLRYLAMDGAVLVETAEEHLNCQQLITLMMENPLPDLPHLKTFISREMPAPLVRELLNKYGSGLEAITFGQVLDGRSSFNRAFLGDVNLSKLKRFSHMAQHPSLSEEPEPSFGVDWPSLEEISLMFMNTEAVHVPKLFGCLNSGLGGGGSRLRVLGLSLHKPEGPMGKLDERTLKMLSLELPQLEKFALSVFRINLKTIDFILPMRALQKLTIVYEKFVSRVDKKNKKGNKVGGGGNHHQPEPAGSSDEIIQFGGNYTSRLYDSIWKLFPELKKVTITVVGRLKESKGMDEECLWKDELKKNVKTKIYTRDGYEQY